VPCVRWVWVWVWVGFPLPRLASTLAPYLSSISAGTLDRGVYA
jgi:hypothetical protein